MLPVKMAFTVTDGAEICLAVAMQVDVNVCDVDLPGRYTWSTQTREPMIAMCSQAISSHGSSPRGPLPHASIDTMAIRQFTVHMRRTCFKLVNQVSSYDSQ